MGGHHHTIAGVTAEFRPAQPLVASAPAPFYLASDCRLAVPVAKGHEIRMCDLETDEGLALMQLRRDQDARFFGRRAQAAM
jgi:predicted homoserine dehydrogenase-like protein